MHRSGDFYRHIDVIEVDSGNGTTIRTIKYVNANNTKFLTRVEEVETDIATLAETATLLSYAWRDLSGNFMNYNEHGATDWGNRYGVTNKVIYDTEGRVHQVLDNSDTAIFTYTYDGISERVLSVTDNTSRTVTYEYNASDSLIKVTDVRNQEWLYSKIGRAHV